MKRSVIAVIVAGLAGPVLSAQVYAQAMGTPPAANAPPVSAVPVPPPPAVPPPAVPAPAADTDAGKGEQPLPGGQFVNVSELEGVDVYSALGEKVGKVDEVVADTDNHKFVVITDGGFLGLGKDKLAVPVDRLAMQDGRLLIADMTEPDIDKIGGLRYEKDNYSRVESPQRVNVPTKP